ncbi:MAG: 16S rRNA (cytidine(1402)-2'-O)-methyltransferase [Coriobacteriales bacterium]|jgi:16S rRNA (cytidine1402-2'-O)-methyltransferase|nr:16S rRNA (cytidine(1402)-2'-O)-methyltransferase [Coriobacteriales bacterium]
MISGEKDSRPLPQVIIALGSNLGDSASIIQQAAKRIARIPDVNLRSLSRTYLSAPAINPDQPDFYNAVLIVQTTLEPEQLLSALQAIEVDFGRDRSHEPVRQEPRDQGQSDPDHVESLAKGPRTLDLDIIDFEGYVLDTATLTLPHPGTLTRDFVVTPLLEIAPHTVLANGRVINRNNIDCGHIIAVLDAEGKAVPLVDEEIHGQDRMVTPEHQNTGREKPGGGTVSLCATPIGNIRDITLRVLDTLRAADAIYCEDTRVTRKLLAYYDIHTPLYRADAHKLPALLPHLLEKLTAGNWLAYATDAGMPTISDPGQLLVKAALDAGFTVEVLPGASALTSALAVSGLKAHNHYFGGFLPRKPGACTRRLVELSALDDTILVFFESAHRTAKTLTHLAEVMPERPVVMARELTKLHEEVVRGSAAFVADTIAERIAAGKPLRGEVVLLVGPDERKKELA